MGIYNLLYSYTHLDQSGQVSGVYCLFLILGSFLVLFGLVRVSVDGEYDIQGTHPDIS